MVSGSDAFLCCLGAHIVGCRCVGMRARCCMWLWCVPTQRLNHRARAVKAPVRFPLCAWLHCRRKDSLQVPGCSECAPLPTLPGFKTRKRRALPEGAVVRFFAARVGGSGGWV